ncbi:MAG TPA: hypothetical protein VFI46_16115 [Jiangellaceae bacterium]|nr:hypothetical protein [Jiangellaceae bacterium]
MLDAGLDGIAEMEADVDARSTGLELSHPPVGKVRPHVGNGMRSACKTRVQTAAAAPPWTECAESWSGIGGLVTSGVQGEVGGRQWVPVGRGLSDGCDWTPVVVVVLRVPGADVAVGERNVEQPEQPCVLPGVEVP